MNEVIQSEETARRILQNQRTLLEQNAKILAFQETFTKEKESTANAKSVVKFIWGANILKGGDIPRRFAPLGANPLGISPPF